MGQYLEADWNGKNTIEEVWVEEVKNILHKPDSTELKSFNYS